MSKAALVQILDRWTGVHEDDPDSRFLTRFLAERDEDAFAALVHRHGPLVYGTCLRILGNPCDTDDAFQAVFFVLARRASTLKLDRSIGPWLHGVAVRVAKKLRGQIVQRRLREMAAARSESVAPAELNHDFWAILDEELARLPRPLRETILLCDLSGQSHAKTAQALGLAKGTITKRLAKAREALGTRLKRRGITLGVGAVTTLMATQARAAVPAPLVLQTARQAVAFSISQVVGSATAKTLAEGVMRSLRFAVLKVWFVAGLVALMLAGGGLMLAGGTAEPGEKKDEQPPAKAEAKPDAAKVGTMWKECYTGGSDNGLRVSAAFSADGKTLLLGDTSGEVMAVHFPNDEPPSYRWKYQVGGAHVAVAYSADQKHVYATGKDSVHILDASSGKEVGRIDEPGSNPISIGVFPKKVIDPTFTQVQIAFGSAQGYFVKTWAEDRFPDTIGSIHVTTGIKDVKPADVAAVPLAVDPKGRSVIMTGPRDGTGELTGTKGKNVLWAYVCGDYSEGSPGNRVMVGHTATVVAAAWAKEGGTAITGDADGRLIVWDAKTMKEARRLELGGRVLAVAISDDGAHTAAYVRGKQGAEVYVWETARPAKGMKPIHTEQGDFGSEPFAFLTFAPDSKHLAGCAGDRKWLEQDPKTLRNVRVHAWELAAEPKGQPAPKHLYDGPLYKRGSQGFSLVENLTWLRVAAKEGALDFGDLRDGHQQGRFVFGDFVLGGMKVSADRKWLAFEQYPLAKDKGDGKPPETFDVGVYQWPPREECVIPSCSQLLDIAAEGKVVAVVRAKQIELWDTAATPKKLKTAPFEHTRLDVARFSPDGKLLALSDCNNLVLWRWEENAQERIALGNRVGSLAFTPDGRFLAEGQAPGKNISIRDLETRKIVRTLTNETKQPMNVSGMAFVQGGRVLIACDNLHDAKEAAVPHHITLWDTATGAIAHQIALPAGLPISIDVSPNGRYLGAMLDEGEAGMKLSVWRLDGQMPVMEAGGAPATGKP